MSFGLLLEDVRLAIIGLGYVGLPLAVEFSKKYPTVGFDIDETRIAELNEGYDRTKEVSKDELRDAAGLEFTSDCKHLDAANVFVITVPTPIDQSKQPDLSHLIAASQMVGRSIARGAVIIYESTVYPGATEEECVPILETVSRLKFNVDFFVGYSPERINPGDQSNDITTIKKVTSGSMPEVGKFVNELYGSIITAGTFLVSSIRVAEAAKVIENIQRDVNIALMNELAILFDRMDIDTEEVLNAAKTKWNFIGFTPGLVGGHCIGVDPYYLTHKARVLNYHPEMILAGRRINDSMSSHVALTLVKAMLRRFGHVVGKHVLIMGLTFKENCPDTRNSKVFDVIDELNRFGLTVEVYDPWVNNTDPLGGRLAALVEEPTKGKYDAIIIAVAHREFRKLGIGHIRSFGVKDAITFDLKHLFPIMECNLRL